MKERVPKMKNAAKTCLVFLVGTAAACAVSPAAAQKMDKIVAIVNSDVVTEQDLAVFMKVADIDPNDLADQDPKLMRRMFIDRLVEDQLILQAARKQELKVDEGAIDERIREMKFRAGSEAAFDRALSSQGFSLAELRAKLREQYLVYAVIQREVRANLMVTPSEVTDYYQEHSSEFFLPETAVLDTIFATDKAKADASREALIAGKPFEDVFKEFSDRANLGSVQRGQLKEELEDFVFGLSPDKPSEPYAFDNGYYIFVLRKIVPPSRRSLEEVKSEIQKKLEGERFEKAYKEWIEKLKEKAYISVREE